MQQIYCKDILLRDWIFCDILPQACDMVLNSTEEEVADGDEEPIDIDSLLDDDTFMSIAFE